VFGFMAVDVSFGAGVRRHVIINFGDFSTYGRDHSGP